MRAAAMLPAAGEQTSGPSTASPGATVMSDQMEA
jgi:hypothetical protein